MIEFVAGGSLSEIEAEALAVPVFADRAWGPGAEWAVEQLGDWVAGYFDAADFEGKKGQTVKVPGSDAMSFTAVYFLGLGEDPDAETIRRASGSLGRAASRVESIATTLHSVDGATAEMVALGLSLGQYRFDDYRSEPKPAKTETVVFVDGTDDDAAEAGRGATIAKGVAAARDLVNEPAAGKPPAGMADRAVAMAADVGVRAVVHDPEAMEEAGMGGVLGVGMGSTNPPRLVELWHEPEDAEAFLAVVGKGIVFDSGGLSLKPAAAMEDMKTDMSGAAAVFGAVQVIAEMGLNVKVLGIMPLAENMPGGAAQRPGDVLRIMNGKTIEVLNTDAEGRLVLADGLSLAAEQDPDLIVDVATLTGACKVALGDHIAGLFGNDDDAVDKVRDAAAAAGERVWPMPLPDDYRKMIDSDIADMKNVGTRWGGAITAAALLKEFVDDKPWAHLDIAGPARAGKDDGYIVTGGTGFGVRTLVSLAESMAG